MPDRFVTRLDTYFLDIVTVRDGGENTIAVHEYPFSSRNELEHVGGKTRRIEVRCVFTQTPTASPGWTIDPSLSLPTYEEHFFFLDLLRSKREDLTFTHPKYGEMVGKVTTFTVDADDHDETAFIDFVFLQHIATEESTFTQYVVPEMAAEFRESNATLTDTLETEEKEAVDTISWTAEANTFINTLDAYLNSLTSPATSIKNQITYGVSTPGRIMESLNGAVDRIVVLYTTGRDAPASFVNNLIVGVRQLKATLSGVNAERVHIMGAARVSYETSVILDEDDAKSREIEDKEASRSFDAEGNYKKVDPLPVTLTSTELDAMLAELKKLLDEAVQIDRNYRTLQEQAALLQKYINKIKLDRERIEEITINSQMSMHLVAMNNGLSYQAAERLLKLNPGIKNPNFTTGIINIISPAVA